MDHFQPIVSVLCTMVRLTNKMCYSQEQTLVERGPRSNRGFYKSALITPHDLVKSTKPTLGPCLLVPFCGIGTSVQTNDL